MTVPAGPIREGANQRPQGPAVKMDLEFLALSAPRVRLAGISGLGFAWALFTLSEKAVAPHSSTLAWKIPWMEEPGRLQSIGVTEGRTRLSDFTFILKKSQAELVGERQWGRTGLETWNNTEQLL